VIDTFNDTEYGLAGGVISQNFAAAQDVVSRIRSGETRINGQGIADEPIAPLGGASHLSRLVATQPEEGQRMKKVETIVGSTRRPNEAAGCVIRWVDR
jgi:acyl-CoA reductase-like NAD-dependent aldehyde dehydrogenase